MSYDNETQATLDALASVFFAAATVWLVLAVLYSLSVLVFIRMRARGQLGSIYDADFGRVYLCGGNSNSNYNGQEGEQQQQQWRGFFCRLYIPMGFLFRRFVMLSRTDEERQRHINQVIRIMTPIERRHAMETLLLARSSSSPSSSSSIVTTANSTSTGKGGGGDRPPFCKDTSCTCCPRQQQQQRPSSVNTTIDTDQDEFSVNSPINESHHGDNQEMISSTVDNNNNNKDSTPSSRNRTAKLGAKHNRMIAAAVGAASSSSPAASAGTLACEFATNEEEKAEAEEGPSCSICLAEFDHDVAAAALEAGIAADYDVLVSKTCTHQFHVDCIMSWLERGNNIECPCCRVPMVTEDQVWATVKEQRKELQRRKKKQQKHMIVHYLMSRFSSLSSFDSFSQRQKRESDNAIGENNNNMDATEQSEVSTSSDLPPPVLEVAQGTSPSPPPPRHIPPPPPPPLLRLQQLPRPLPRSHRRASDLSRTTQST